MKTLPPLSGTQSLLRIFCGESDKINHLPLYRYLVELSKKRGLKGCSVFRGVAGFGASSILHQEDLTHLFSSDLPMVVEIVDVKEKIQAFVHEISPLLQGCLVTEEPVEIYCAQQATTQDFKSDLPQKL